MVESTIDDIRTRAHALNDAGRMWHFHMFPPDCLFNEGPSMRHAFVLEDMDADVQYVAVSDQRESALGRELVPLIHGETILVEPTEAPVHTEPVRRMLERATALSGKKVPWHHHVFPPVCQYNDNVGRWTMVFEDHESGELIESVTDDEPRDALNALERLYYEQDA